MDKFSMDTLVPWANGTITGIWEFSYSPEYGKTLLLSALELRQIFYSVTWLHRLKYSNQ